MSARAWFLVCALALFAAAACSDKAATGPAITSPVPVGTDGRAPGECAAPESLATIQIRTNGTTNAPTFGVGSSDCGGATGKGYIVFDYSPILIEAVDSFEITIAGDATATVTWPDPAELTSTGKGTWKSATLKDVCKRLTIDLASPDGASRATYGADIRFGGPTVPCPVRDAATPPEEIIAPDSVPDTSEPDSSLVLPPIPDPISIPIPTTGTATT